MTYIAPLKKLLISAPSPATTNYSEVLPAQPQLKKRTWDMYYIQYTIVLVCS